MTALLAQPEPAQRSNPRTARAAATPVWGGWKEKVRVESPAGTVTLSSPSPSERIGIECPCSWADQPGISSSFRVTVAGAAQWTATWLKVMTPNEQAPSAVE
jgi:hypothetical protein